MSSAAAACAAISAGLFGSGCCALRPIRAIVGGAVGAVPGFIGGVHGVPSLASVYVGALTTMAKWPRSVSIDGIAKAQSLMATWNLSMEV